MNKYNNFLLLFSILLLTSCVSLDIDAVIENIEPKLVDVVIKDHNILFEDFLDSQWDEGMEDSPVFASMLGIKKYNKQISSNSIEQFNINKDKSLSALNKLQSFDQSKILDDLKLSIQPFKSTSNRAMRQRNYDLGKIVWKEAYIGGDVICVLAFRKLDDTRLLQSIEVFDVHLVLRNCVKDNLDNALLPISSPNFNLQNLTSVHTASPEKFKRSVLAGPNG